MRVNLIIPAKMELLQPTLSLLLIAVLYLQGKIQSADLYIFKDFNLF